MRRNILFSIFILTFGGLAMAADTGTTDELVQLQKQVTLLQQQLAVVNAQIALDTAKQSQDAQLAKAAAEALKNQLGAQIALETEQAKGPFAELSGIKAATSGMQLPTGKSGTVQLAAGTAGTALLRTKGAMLQLLDSVASDLSAKLPAGAVLVTEAQLEQAYQADFTRQRIADQTRSLSSATNRAAPVVSLPPEKGIALRMVMPEVVAAAYSAGLVLDTLNSLGKLFRVDRKADVFSADEEAAQLLGYLLEAKNPKFTAKPMLMNKNAAAQATGLLDQLTALHNAVQAGTDRLASLKKIEEDEAKTKPAKSALPPPERITELNAQLTGAKALLESLDPSKKAEAFWNQVKGQLLGAAIDGRDRLLIEAKGQALQISESRWYTSDRIKTVGEILVAYRVQDKDGAITKSGVVLKASEAKTISFDDMPEMTFQTGN